MNKLTQPLINFNATDWEEADRVCHLNCGPTALAVMTRTPLIKACEVIPGYKERLYTNPTMMSMAIHRLGFAWRERDDAECEGHTLTEYGLVRIQWEGPWTAEGANPRWAYRETHWIGAAKFFWPDPDKAIEFVFDVNCGWQTRLDWQSIHVPKIIKEVVNKRATGNWWATHRWELEL